MKLTEMSLKFILRHQVEKLLTVALRVGASRDCVTLMVLKKAIDDYLIDVSHLRVLDMSL